MANQDQETRYRTIFNRCDGNNDGYISMGELENFINSNSADAKAIPSYVVNKIHRKAYENENKKMDYRQFVNLMERCNCLYIIEDYFTKYINFIVPYKPACLESETGERLMHIYSCCPPPFFILLVSIIELTFYLVDEKSGTKTLHTMFMYDASKRHEFWRYWTYMFIHDGPMHIYGNVGLQLLVGIPLEKVYSWWRVMIIYFAGGITGSLAHTLVSPIRDMVGASGGIYSLLTAHIACVIMNWDEVLCPYYQMIFFCVYVAIDLGTDFYHSYIQGIIIETALEAHAGGAVAGLLMGMYMLRQHQATRTEKYFYWAALIVYFLLVGCAIVLNVTKPGLIEKPVSSD